MLWIKESYVDATKGGRYSDVDWYETKFADNELRPMFKNLVKEFGRVRSMWRDKAGGGREQVGWVFEKRVEYDDNRANTPIKQRTYLREVWVEVSIGPASRRRLRRSWCRHGHIHNPTSTAPRSCSREGVILAYRMRLTRHTKASRTRSGEHPRTSWKYTTRS